jgi:hypothetical protein
MYDAVFKPKVLFSFFLLAGAQNFFRVSSVAMQKQQESSVLYL